MKKEIGGFIKTKTCIVCSQTFNTRYASRRICTSERCVKAMERSYHGIRSFTIFQRDFFRCIYCGRSSIEHGIILEPDHIIPVSKGGSTIASNLVTSCHDCNASKHCKAMDTTTLERIIQIVKQRNEQTGLLPSTIVKMVTRKAISTEQEAQ